MHYDLIAMQTRFGTIVSWALKCLYEVKNSDFIFLNKIEACHVNNHSPRNEINVICTFRDNKCQKKVLNFTK